MSAATKRFEFARSLQSANIETTFALPQRGLRRTRLPGENRNGMAHKGFKGVEYDAGFP
jgi:hypothetical protein